MAMGFRHSRRSELVIFAAVVTVVALVFLALAAGNELAALVAALKAYGYIGGFILGFLSSFTIFIPSPAFVAVLGMAAFLNPLLLGIATGIGSGLGEMTAYAIGSGAEAAIRRKKDFQEGIARIRGLFNRYHPDVVVFAFAALPLLPVDIVGIFCGFVRYGWKRFLVITAAGKIIKFTALALIGAAALQAVAPFMAG